MNRSNSVLVLALAVALSAFVSACVSGPGENPPGPAPTCQGATDLSNDPSNCGECGYACTAAETCREGLCLRSTLMICGSASRPLSQFISPAFAMSTVASCAPDGATQALFLHRSWPFQPSTVTTVALRDYLQGGGIVITEYSTSHLAWERAFAVPTVQGNGGSRLGPSCTDAMPTVAQFSPTDPFWSDNPWEPMAIGSAGCGYPVQGFAGITPLSGWDATNAALGYRNYGRGRFWAVDWDWGDNQTGQMIPYTLKRMQYMATHRR